MDLTLTSFGSSGNSGFMSQCVQGGYYSSLRQFHMKWVTLG